MKYKNSRGQYITDQYHNLETFPIELKITTSDFYAKLKLASRPGAKDRFGKPITNPFMQVCGEYRHLTGVCDYEEYWRLNFPSATAGMRDALLKVVRVEDQFRVILWCGSKIRNCNYVKHFEHYRR